MMGTRCGDFDLGALLYIMDREKLSLEQANNLINKKSGLLGVSGFSSDMRDIEEEAFVKKNPRAKLTFDMFCYRVKKYVGAYAAIMGGVDLLIFTGGIGENGWDIRYEVCKNMEFIGLHFNNEANKGVRSVVKEISMPNSKVKVMIYPTDEEYVIAHDTFNIINEK
jgi:acetate kinase